MSNLRLRYFSRSLLGSIVAALGLWEVIVAHEVYVFFIGALAHTQPSDCDPIK